MGVPDHSQVHGGVGEDLRQFSRRKPPVGSRRRAQIEVAMHEPQGVAAPTHVQDVGQRPHKLELIGSQLPIGAQFGVGGGSVTRRLFAIEIREDRAVVIAPCCAPVGTPHRPFEREAAVDPAFKYVAVDEDEIGLGQLVEPAVQGVQRLLVAVQIANDH